MSPGELDAAVERVRGEFLEMPGLRLTVPQAARLWGLDPTACEEVLDVLIRSSLLDPEPQGVRTLLSFLLTGRTQRFLHPFHLLPVVLPQLCRRDRPRP